MKKIRVLVVDDSLLFRETITRYITKDDSIEVVATAANAFEARDKLLELHPDVMTLDIEMPKMNGIEFLTRLLPQYPMPTVVVSSSAISAFDAVDAGAVDYIKKPSVRKPAEMAEFAEELISKIKVAKRAKVPVADNKINLNTRTSFSTPISRKDMVIALGASTGGTDALQVVVQNLPPETPPIVIVQHMPAGFTKMYADRLNRVCRMEVHEAQDGDRLKTGQIIIGAGEYHLRLAKDSKGYYVTSKQGDKVSGHCPSVDVLFESVAEVAKANAIGAILTGMGKDGASGLLKMKTAGAFTIGQDKDSCVVYGMPMVAFNIGAVERQAPLDQIAALIMDRLK